MVDRCWPAGRAITIKDGSYLNGKLCEPYKKTKEGWWLVFLKDGSLYLLLKDEYEGPFWISWQ